MVPESLLKRRKAFATMKAIRIKKMLAEKKVKRGFCILVRSVNQVVFLLVFYVLLISVQSLPTNSPVK